MHAEAGSSPSRRTALDMHAMSDALARLSRWLTLAAFAVAIVVALDAPIVALSWSQRPFPGFVVEHTLVVADLAGPDWPGAAAGLGHPFRITHLDGQPVADSAAFQQALAGRAIGETLAVRAVLPDGSGALEATLPLGAFPARDLVRLFWIPYAVGLAYLAIGAWIYRLRGRTRPGRALAFFCVCTALVCGLLFDLNSTHGGTALWTIAVAQLGGALTSLALRFPVEWRPVARRPWILALPYGLSIVLALTALAALRHPSNPWAYIDAWRAAYLYAGLGILLFLGGMAFRAARRDAPVAQQQARVVLYGSLLAFGPVAAWFLSPALGVPLQFNAALFLPALLLFPLAVGLAILRYRLWAIDLIVRRTLVYTVLTGLLASIYLGVIVVLQWLIVAVEPRASPLAIAVSTLLIAALFNPLRRHVQDFIDRRFFRRRYDRMQVLTAFGSTARDEVDLGRLTGRLLGVVRETMQPEALALALRAPKTDSSEERSS